MNSFTKHLAAQLFIDNATEKQLLRSAAEAAFLKELSEEQARKLKEKAEELEEINALIDTACQPGDIVEIWREGREYLPSIKDKEEIYVWLESIGVIRKAVKWNFHTLITRCRVIDSTIMGGIPVTAVYIPHYNGSDCEVVPTCFLLHYKVSNQMYSFYGETPHIYTAWRKRKMREWKTLQGK